MNFWRVICSFVLNLFRLLCINRHRYFGRFVWPTMHRDWRGFCDRHLLHDPLLFEDLPAAIVNVPLGSISGASIMQGRDPALKILSFILHGLLNCWLSANVTLLFRPFKNHPSLLLVLLCTLAFPLSTAKIPRCNFRNFGNTLRAGVGLSLANTSIRVYPVRRNYVLN